MMITLNLLKENRSKRRRSSLKERKKKKRRMMMRKAKLSLILICMLGVSNLMLLSIWLKSLLSLRHLLVKLSK
jgi:cell division septal protein FtsQ